MILIDFLLRPTVKWLQSTSWCLSWILWASFDFSTTLHVLQKCCVVSEFRFKVQTSFIGRAYHVIIMPSFLLILVIFRPRFIFRFVFFTSSTTVRVLDVNTTLAKSCNRLCFFTFAVSGFAEVRDIWKRTRHCRPGLLKLKMACFFSKQGVHHFMSERHENYCSDSLGSCHISESLHFDASDTRVIDGTILQDFLFFPYFLC